MTRYGFFGRTGELAEIEAVADRAFAGEPSMLVIDGVAGIGKSSLVMRAIDELRPRMNQAIVACSAFDATPSEPIERLLVQLTDEPLLVESVEGPDPVGDPLRAARITEQVAAARLVAAILAGAEAGPTVIVIDDLQWAKPPVLDVLTLLGIELATERQQPLLVVGITRPITSDHPLRGKIDRLLEEEFVTPMTLGPLDEAATAELVRHHRPDASAAVVAHVEGSSGRNPLLAETVLDTLHRQDRPSGLAASDPTTWSSGVAASDPTHDPLTAWIDSLDPDLTRWCGRLAAAGPVFSRAGAAALLGGEAVDTILDRARTNRLIDGDDRAYHFPHETLRDALHRSLTETERAESHQRLACELRRSSKGIGTRIQIGRHLLASGDRAENADRVTDLFAAFEAAYEVRAWGDATRFFEAHLGLIDRSAAEPSRSFDLLLKGGLAHAFNADHEAARTRLHDALVVAGQLDDDRRAEALVPLVRITASADPDGEGPGGDLPELDAFLASGPGASALSRVLQARADGLVTTGLIDEGRALAARSLELATGSEDQPAAAYAGQVLGDADLIGCRPTDSVDHYRRALRIAEHAEDWFTMQSLRSRLAISRLAAGDLRRSTTEAIAVGRQAAASHEYTNRSVAEAAQGIAAYLRGDLRQAIRHTGRAAGQGRRADHAPIHLLVDGTEGLTHLAMADREATIGVARRATCPLAIIPAALLLLAGESTDADHDGESASRLLDPHVGVAAAHAVASFSPDAAPEPGLADHVAVLEEAAARGCELSPTLPISIRRGLGSALAALRRDEEALEHLAAAAELWRREDGLVELVEVLIVAAVVNRRLGDHAAADRAATEADHLADRLGMTSARARARQLYHPLDGDSIDPGRIDERMIVMSDVVGSTEISTRLGDQAYYDLVMEHHRLVRQRLTDLGGTEFSEGGDSLFAWFSSPEDALDCALAIVADAADRRRSGIDLSVKVSIAGGEPFFSDGRPYGSVVNRAARLAGEGGADQVVVDEVALARLSPVVSGFAIRTADLKGLGHQTIGVLHPTSDRNCTA